MKNNEISETLNEKIKLNKTKFEELMVSTHVACIERLLQYLDSNGFYRSPYSINHPLSEEGGLLEHSLNVIDFALKLAEILGYEYKESVILAAGLHDIGKMGKLIKPRYSSKSSKDGQPTSKTLYIVNPDLMSVPHEIRSFQIASKYIELEKEENFAILYHNGLYGPLKCEIKGNEIPLYMIIHWADMAANRVIE